MATKIEWTDLVDNIIVVKGGGWWCRMISPGCANCYAARLNQSPFFGGNKLAYAGSTPELELRRDLIDGWARQRVAKKHFVASMTDVFGEWVEREWIFAFLDGMRAAPLQTFQILTKRPAVAAREIAAWLKARGLATLPANIWIGTSVEDQTRADERIPLLLSIPARVRFLSCEPLLGPVNLGIERRVFSFPKHIGSNGAIYDPKHLPFHWVIVGGESGPRARLMHPNWPLSIRDQCAAAGVSFFFKQWGEWVKQDGRVHRVYSEHRFVAEDGLPLPNESEVSAGLYSETLHTRRADLMMRVGKKEAGRLLDGHIYNEFPTA